MKICSKLIHIEERVCKKKITTTPSHFMRMCNYSRNQTIISLTSYFLQTFLKKICCLSTLLA